MSEQPGRSCPIHYRYQPERLCRDPEPVKADVLYVIGGLYGNPLALDAIDAMAASEQALGRRVKPLFNGDFNWFNADEDAFVDVNNRVLAHDIIQGNVEYELANPSPDAGCGCAYPDFVDNGTVERSNRIITRLQAIASRHPDIQASLRAAPRWRCLSFGGETLLILHGDPESLAGWGLASENLSRPSHQHQLHQWFAQTGATLMACTHTCLPALWKRHDTLLSQTIINNGSAGMGNLHADPRGLITRVSTIPADTALASVRQGDLEVSLVPVAFDAQAWVARFDQCWPTGSDAAISYRQRILKGTKLTVADIRL